MSSHYPDQTFSINACGDDTPEGLHKFHWSAPRPRKLQAQEGSNPTPSCKPAMEIQETRDSFYVLLELPGLNCEEIGIQIVNETLTIQGYRKPKFHIPARAVLDSEFHYGAFERSILIPGPIQKEKVIAEYTDGILTISLAKTKL